MSQARVPSFEDGRAVRPGQPRPWAERLSRWGGAGAIHLLLAAMLMMANGSPPARSGGFGGAISVTLVSAASSQGAAASSVADGLKALQERLATSDVPASTPPTPPPPSTAASLSDLMGDGDAPDAAQAGKGAASNASGAPSSSDDPFSRGSVSYRGDDPIKIARVQAQAAACAKTAGSARVLLLIDAEGRLFGRPRLIAGPASDSKAGAALLAAIERCGPFVASATPGAPRSYEVQFR